MTRARSKAAARLRPPYSRGSAWRQQAIAKGVALLLGTPERAGRLLPGKNRTVCRRIGSASTGVVVAAQPSAPTNVQVLAALHRAQGFGACSAARIQRRKATPADAAPVVFRSHQLTRLLVTSGHSGTVRSVCRAPFSP